MSGVAAPARPRIFYGWYVVAATFAVLMVGFGNAYTFSAFIAGLQHEFDASRGSVSLVFSLAGFLYFGLGVLSGPASDRWGARRLAVIGMLLVGAGMALAGMARNLNEVYLAYGLGVGLGVGCAYVPVVGVVQRWFLRRRGFASGLAISGIGVGTLLMPPLATLLIDTLGWRHAYFVLGGIAVLVGAGMALLVRDDPAARGLGPDGDPPRAGVPGVAAPGMTLREALRTPHFTRLYLASLLSALGVFVPFVHLVPYALDHGIAATWAAPLLGAIGVGSTVGRFGLGGLADRIGRQNALLATFVGMAAALAMWAVSSSFWSLALFALVFGTFYGGWVAVMPSVVMDMFGPRRLGTILGALYTSAGIGALIGPTAAGFAFDFSGSYTAPILASVAANLAAAAIVATLARRRVAGGTPAA